MAVARNLLASAYACMLRYACTNKLVEVFIMVEALSLRLPTKVLKRLLKRNLECGRADVGRKPWHDHSSIGV